MDETPIKAGRAGHGKMHTGYFWPIYGEHDEVYFPFHASRYAELVCQALGITPALNAVLLTDGFAAYETYAQKTGIAHGSVLVARPARLLRGVVSWVMIKHDLCGSCRPSEGRMVFGNICEI